jgi:2-dehydro-3-deoxyphosphooctonate aldolase (KDO 8-P synthase)
MVLAQRLKEITSGLGVPLIFKASYDKANRTSVHSYRGPGLKEGLEILGWVREQVGVPVISDVHEVAQAVNIKKGQFLSPWEASNILDKARSVGATKLMITERGTSFGYNNLVVDMKGLPVLRSFGVPVVFDATHSVQLPGGTGQASGGQAEFIPALARAAVAAGVDGLFVEVHDQPDKALSDGSNALQIDLLPGLLKTLLRIRKALE